jgi:hypothetical protein
MKTSWRRYEVLLPLRFNDGKEIPDALIAQTLLELRQKFGAISVESQTIRGHWQHRTKVYRDDLMRVFLDVQDIPANRQWFESMKVRLKKRFKQLDIWMTTYPIEVLK